MADAHHDPASMRVAVKVFVVDDDMFVRSHLAALLPQFGDLVITGVFADGAEAIAATAADPPDVILMDITMAGMDGIEATRRIRKQTPQVQILALPVLDLVIATAAILLIARSAAQSRTPLILVGVAFLLYSVSDMAYAVNVSVGAAGLGSWWDLGWMGGYFFLSLAALHPDPAEPVAHRSAEPSAVIFIS